MFDILFNGAMLVSALALTVVVAVKAQIATGQPQFVNQTAQPRAMDASGQDRATLPQD